MTKQEVVKQIEARETDVEAVTVLAVVEGFMEEVRAAHDPQGKRFPPRFWYVPD